MLSSCCVAAFTRTVSVSKQERSPSIEHSEPGPRSFFRLRSCLAASGVEKSTAPDKG